MNQKITYLLAHIALFIVFFWFGALKLFGLSPATELVEALFLKIPFLNMMDFDIFIVLLGLFEMMLAVLFLFPKTTKLGVYLLLPHMFTTLLPLILLPDMTWIQVGAPTLEGQYIIKNIVIVALALSVVLEKRKGK
jgi:uncharacterized membrane protein YkgB